MDRAKAKPVSWAGELVFGESWAVFRGQAADNTPHAHAAIQLVFGEVDDVTVLSGDGTEHMGQALVIRPLVEHSLIATGAVTLLYVEPQSPLAFAIADLIEDADIAPISPQLLRFNQTLPIAEWIEYLARLAQTSSEAIDPRLMVALQRLGDEPGSISIADAAIAANLSESRLRALARDRLGLPLSTWLIWRKLDCAARVLQRGASLADAAVSGGFADQAHLARAMRRMFGITPRTAQHASNRSVQD